MCPAQATSRRRISPPCLAFSFLLTLGWLPPSWAETPEPQLKLGVRTYNYAAVSGDILLRAEQQSAEIFRRAGIELAWIQCPVSPGEVDKFPACAPNSGSLVLTLKILPESMAAGFGLPLKNFGVTLQHHASFVFYDRVQLANRVGLSEPVVLGHIIAHELGHLLLGEGGHSDKGIMMEDLRVRHFRHAEKGRPLTYSTEQAERMRARLRPQLLAGK